MNRKIVKSRFFVEDELQETIGEASTATPDPWGEDAKLNVVGKPVERSDAYEKVSGSATYTFDIRLPRMAHARTLRSPHPHAKIRSIDVSEALNMKGVLARRTYRGITGLPGCLIPTCDMKGMTLPAWWRKRKPSPIVR